MQPFYHPGLSGSVLFHLRENKQPNVLSFPADVISPVHPTLSPRSSLYPGTSDRPSKGASWAGISALTLLNFEHM